MRTLLVLSLLALCAVPAAAEVSIQGSLEDAQVVLGAYLDRGGMVTPSAALCAPIESKDHETSDMLIAGGKAYANDFKKPHSKPLDTIAGGVAYVGGKVLRHAEIDLIAKGRESLPSTWGEWQVVGRIGLGTQAFSGKAHVAVTYTPEDFFEGRFRHPDGGFAAGAVWRW